MRDCFIQMRRSWNIRPTAVLTISSLRVIIMLRSPPRNKGLCATDVNQDGSGVIFGIVDEAQRLDHTTTWFYYLISFVACCA